MRFGVASLLMLALSVPASGAESCPVKGAAFKTEINRNNYFAGRKLGIHDIKWDGMVFTVTAYDANGEIEPVHNRWIGTEWFRLQGRTWEDTVFLRRDWALGHPQVADTTYMRRDDEANWQKDNPKFDDVQGQLPFVIAEGPLEGFLLKRVACGAPKGAGNPIPQFRDYRVTVYSGPAGKLTLDTDDKRMMRTRLRNGMREPTNFAGEWHIVSWGCGTNCLGGTVINRRTGDLVSLPDEVSMWDLKHKPNSTLLVGTNRGYNNSDSEVIPTWYFYRFDGKRFHIVHVITDPDHLWDEYTEEEAADEG